MLNLQVTHFFLQQSDLCRIFLYSRKQLLLLNQKFFPLLYNLILSGLVFNLALQLNNALVQSVYLVKTFAKGCLFVVLDFAAHVVMEFLELREIILIKPFSLVIISLLFTAELRHLQFFHFYYKAKLNLAIKQHIEWYTKVCVFILEQFYKMNNTSSKPFHLKKNQFFHNRGWIASNFKVKTSAISLAKLKQKQFQRSLHQIIPLMPIHTRSMEVGLKPTTATIKSENMSKMEMVDSDQLSAFNTMFQMKSSNFKTSVGNKKSLLFMRPYTKDRAVSMTIDEKKSQVYQQINNPDVLLLSDYFNKKGVIEYLTQYKESYSTQISKEKARPKTSSKRCMNVLKEKLKKKCKMTSYQSKMKGLKYQ